MVRQPVPSLKYVSAHIITMLLNSVIFLACYVHSQLKLFLVSGLTLGMVGKLMFHYFFLLLGFLVLLFVLLVAFVLIKVLARGWGRRAYLQHALLIVYIYDTNWKFGRC